MAITNDGNDKIPEEMEQSLEALAQETDDSDIKAYLAEKLGITVEAARGADDEASDKDDAGGRKDGPGTKRADMKDETAPLGEILPVEQTLPSRLTLVPLQGRPIFPGIFTPLMINVPDDVAAVDKAYSADGFIGLVLVKNEVDSPCVKDLYSVGTVARIVKRIKLPDGGMNAFVSTMRRFRIRRTLSASGSIVAAVQYLSDEEDDTFEVKALTRALISEMKEISENNPLFTEEMRLNMVNIDQPGKIADFITSILNIEKDEQQKVLEMTNVRQRMEQCLVFIKKEQELFRMQRRIQAEINERVEKNQREYFLREEMKSIQEELGVAGSKGSDYQKFKERVDALKFEGEILEAVDGELEKFQLLDPQSPEYIGTRNFLDLVVNLPWRAEPRESYDLEKAFRTLQKDHYGMEDVKKRIMEYLSVRKLKDDNKGSVLILVGPPGVGKTSVGRSIARAMNKPFYRFSVGGMRDEAEIKGHRRTYIGSMPGKILQGLRITKQRDPVFLIDEIDKMAPGSVHGDPASALLEVLDPEQNVTFRDNYLDLPFDISDIFFILTANTLDSIPEPLLDRAEIISLSGYIDQEKLEIARKYLVPKNLEKNGLGKSQVRYTKSALLEIAEEYARESGVRNFERCLDKIHRKLVREHLDGTAGAAEDAAERTAVISREELAGRKFTIDAPDLKKYLGKPVFDESEIKMAAVPGTAIGLAWTSMGGDTLLIESITFPSKSGLELTGQMGDVMKESAEIAMNWARSYALRNRIKRADWFEKNTIHLHIPEGATPKDGPSAGITMATAFLSLLKGKKIRQHLAMTGELSLTGMVLPIGGLREKTVAARRNKIKTIIIPKANERDLDEIPAIVKRGLTFLPVSRAEEVMDIVFR